VIDIDQEDAGRFISWLLGEATANARGTRQRRLTVAPEGRFWLGRLAPAISVLQSRLGERAERLDPCEVGFRVRPTEIDGRSISCRVRLLAWREIEGAGDDPEVEKWEKTEPVDVTVNVTMPRQIGAIAVAGRAENEVGPLWWTPYGLTATVLPITSCVAA
jgi:hypothetical protein